MKLRRADSLRTRTPQEVRKNHFIVGRSPFDVIWPKRYRRLTEHYAETAFFRRPLEVVEKHFDSTETPLEHPGERAGTSE